MTTPTLTLHTVDPRDEADFRRWFDATTAIQADAWPDEPGWQYAEQRAMALNAHGGTPSVRVVALEAGRVVVGTGAMELPDRDNTHLAEGRLEVLPDHRRRGVGSALLVELERLAADDGRAEIVVLAEEPTRWAGRGPAAPFAARRGYRRALVEYRRDLPLPFDAARFAALEASCRPFAAGYWFRAWRNRCPDDLVEDRAALGRRMSTDAPAGEVTREEEAWDGDRVRRLEELFRAQDRTYFAVGAIEQSSGRMVAFSELALPNAAPELAYQWDTLVLREHRGHRLGTLMKIANLRQLVAASPATNRICTWNAETNAPMIAVNEALGCVVVGTVTSWRKVLA